MFIAVEPFHVIVNPRPGLPDISSSNVSTIKSRSSFSISALINLGLKLSTTLFTTEKLLMVDNCTSYVFFTLLPL